MGESGETKQQPPSAEEDGNELREDRSWRRRRLVDVDLRSDESEGER